MCTSFKSAFLKNIHAFFSMKVNLYLKLKLFGFILRATNLLFLYGKIQKQKKLIRRKLKINENMGELLDILKITFLSL